MEEDFATEDTEKDISKKKEETTTTVSEASLESESLKHILMTEDRRETECKSTSGNQKVLVNIVNKTTNPIFKNF